MAAYGKIGELHVLLVEDNPADADLIREHLEDARTHAPSLHVAETLHDALEVLEEPGGSPIAAVLLDLNLPDSTGLDTLRVVHDAHPEMPVLVLTGMAEEETGVEAVRLGAEDFLPKGELTAPVLIRSIRYAIERERTLAELRRTRDRFQATFEAGPHGRLLVDPEGVIVEANRLLADLFGYEPDELIGVDVEALVPEGLRAGHEERRRSYLERPTDRPMGTDLELRGRRRDGTEFPVEIGLSPIRRSDDLQILGVVRDVTEQLAREEHVRFQAELLDAVGQAVIATDLDGTIRYWNEAAEELYGWSVEEAIGADVVELTLSVQRRDEAQSIMETLRRGDSWTGEFEVRRKDGTTFPALVTNAPIRENGRLVGIIGVSTDITRIVETEEELARTNRALRVVGASNQAVLRSASEEEILAEACRIAVEEGGYAFAWIGFAEDDPERTVRPVAAGGREDGYLEGLRVSWSTGDRGRGPTGTAIRTGEPSVSRDTRADPDFAPWREVALERGFRSTAAIPLTDRDTCLGALNIYSTEPDAFDERELEILSELGEDLAHGIMVHRAREKDALLQERLAQSEKLRAIGQLAGGVAHDFNNYLTVITTLTDLLLEDSAIGEERARDLREIRAAADHSAHLARQLLTFSRRDVRSPEVVDLNRAVDKTASMLERLLGEPIELELELASDPEPAAILVDRGQLEQILMNLAINGRDAMPQGGTLTIRTEHRQMEERGDRAAETGEGVRHAVLEVSDTGVGMDEETRSRLFEPFFTTKEGGTGLGLATVYGIVQEAGGQIRVDSEPGRGATFTLLFPEARPQDEGAHPHRRRSTGPEDLSGDETILVVEDVDAVRGVCRRILERYGYRVLEAGCVEDALRVGRDADHDVHLVLTDLGLPDGDGTEVVRRLRDARPDLPAVFTSGYTPGEVGALREYEPDAWFVEKPYDPEELAGVVRTVLDAGRPEPGEA